MTKDIFSFWGATSRQDHLHPKDAPVLERVDHNFDLRCLPGAFIGPLRTAKVVLLSLSPGLSNQDVQEASTKEGQARYHMQRQGNATLPSKEEHKGAWEWWRSRTKVFWEEEGDDGWMKIVDKLAILNIGAYHSRNFHHYELLASLPSSRMSIDWAQSHLFPAAIKQQKTVICLRASSYWGLGKAGKSWGSLYSPCVTPGAHMHRGDLRDRIIDDVRKRLLL